MSIGSAVAVMLATAPCDSPERLTLPLAAATTDDGFRAELETLEQQLRGPLLVGSELELPRAEQLQRVKERLGASCSLEQLPPKAAGADRARLAEILDRPEFAHARDRHNVLAELWGRFWEWFQSLLAFEATQRFSEATRALVLGLALAVIGVAGLRLARVRRGSRRGVLSAPSEVPLELKDPSVHLRLAREAFARDRREAIRQGLLCLLSTLERRRWARPDRVKTNRELAAELPKRGAPAEVVATTDRLVRWFDRAFYSLEEVPEGEARRFLEDVGALGLRLGEAA